jgi:hypothetical protein
MKRKALKSLFSGESSLSHDFPSKTATRSWSNTSTAEDKATIVWRGDASTAEEAKTYRTWRGM